MARFVVHIAEKTKRRKRVYAYVALVIGIAGILYDIFSDDRQEFARYIPLFLGVSCLLIGVGNLRSIRNPRFIEINEHHIEWMIHEKSSLKILIEWIDIRRIKKENDGSVTIFQDSSFSNNISWVGFSGEQQEEIFQLIAQYAEGRQIQLINFSESSLALA